MRFDGVRFTAFDRNTTPALEGTDFYPTVPLHVDRQGVLWIATTGGLVRYNVPRTRSRRPFTSRRSALTACA